MKIFTTLRQTLAKGLLCLMCAVPMLNSCYDDSELWGEIDELTNRVNQLEVDLNAQLKAFNELIEKGSLTISECVQNQNGTYTIVLSDGTKFSLLPVSQKTDNVKTILTYKEVDGVKYWALNGKDGEAVLLTDANGHYIPVTFNPTIKVQDGVYYLVIDGKSYVTGYSTEDIVTIFTDYTLNTDDNGNVYSVTFTFGENGEKVTITVDGYKGFSFLLGSSMIGGTVITDLYVDYGCTYQVSATMDGVVDYVMQVPDGWRVKEVYDSALNETYFDITAPTRELIESGAAVSLDQLKVVAVIEGGDAMVAKLTLSTSPFKTLTATPTNAVIEKYNGVEKFIYGLVSADDYDEEAIFAGADALLQANDKGISESDINVPFEAILGEEIVAGQAYVLYAVPVFYAIEGEDAYYYVKEGVIEKHVFGGTSVKLSTTDIYPNDVTISFSLLGVDAYYGGTDYMSETLIEDILYKVNNGIWEAYSSPMSYEGSAFTFPVEDANEGVTVKRETTYLTWVVPVAEGKVYTEDDIVAVEYTVPSISAGSDVEVTFGTAEIGRTNITVPIKAEGATKIIYSFLNERNASKYPSDEKKIEYLLKSGTEVDGPEYNAFTEGLDPDKKVFLFALAVDADGRYGAVNSQEYVTEELVYNNLTVTLATAEIREKDAKVSVSVSGGTATDYIWWYGKEIDEFWASDDYCDKSESTGSEYMALYPEDAHIQRAMANSTLADGVLALSELEGETTYVVMVLAKDNSGNYSKAESVKFTTMAIDLGTIVRSGTQKWNDAKAATTVEFIQNSFVPAQGMGYAKYGVNFSGPTNLTAFVLLGSTGYFRDGSTLEQQIVDLIAYTDDPTDVGKSVPMRDENGNIILNENGDPISQDDPVKTGMFILYDYYAHGCHIYGNVVYYQESDHNPETCEHCIEAQKKIDNKLSKDYYMSIAGEYYWCKTEEEALAAYETYMNTPEFVEHYSNAKPISYINKGEKLYLYQPSAIGDTEYDKVYVMYRETDTDGTYNYFEPIVYDLPEGCFGE